LFLVVSTSAINCLKRLVSEMSYYASNGTLNRTHSLTVGSTQGVKYRTQAWKRTTSDASGLMPN